MTLRWYLILMSIITAVSWIALFFVMMMIDPTATNWIGFSLFYSSLFFALIGTTAMIGFAIRFSALKQELAFRAVGEAFRQSFLFATFMIVVLILLSRNLFNWISVITLILALSLLEFFLISYNKNPKINN